MPKEKIQSESGEFQLEVSWGEVGPVQLATTNPDRPFDDRGWYVDFDRDRLNQLIRVLRRARDKAFGQDA